MSKLIENPIYYHPNNSKIPLEARQRIMAFLPALIESCIRACGMDLAQSLSDDYLALETGTKVEFILPQPCRSRVIHEDEQGYHHVVFHMIVGSLAAYNDLNGWQLSEEELQKEARIIGPEIWDVALQTVCTEKVEKGQLTETVIFPIKLADNNLVSEEMKLVYRLNQAVKINTTPTFENFKNTGLVM